VFQAAQFRLGCPMRQRAQAEAGDERVSARPSASPLLLGYILAGIDEPILCQPEYRRDHRVHRSASQGCGRTCTACGSAASSRSSSWRSTGSGRAVTKSASLSPSTPREIGQEAQRRKIAPVCVIDSEQCRRRTTQSGDKPVKPVQSGE